MAQSVVVNFVAKTGGAIKDINRLNKAVGKNVTKMERFRAGIKRATPAAIVGLTAIGTFGVAALKKYSDRAEAAGFANEVLGDGFKYIQKQAKDAWRTVGLNETAYYESAAIYANLLREAGYAEKKIPELTHDLIRAASDIASATNKPVEQVANAIRSGLLGENEPLKQLNIINNEKRTLEKAIEMGLATSKKDLTEQEKIMARRAIILEEMQKQNMTGNWDKTKDQFAGQLKQVQAVWDDVMANMGESGTGPASMLLGSLIKLGEWAKENTGLFNGIIAGLTGFLGVIVALRVGIFIFETLGVVMAAALSPIGLFIIAAVAIGTALFVAYKKSEKFRAFMEGLGEFLKAAFEITVEVVKWVVEQIVEYWRAAQRYFTEELMPIIQAVGDVILYLWDKWKPTLTKIFDLIMTVINGVIIPLGKAVADVVKLIVAIFQGDWGAAWEAAKGVVSNAVTAIVTWFLKLPLKLLSVGIELAKMAGDWAWDMLKAIGNGLVNLGEAIWEKIKQGMEWLGEKIKDALTPDVGDVARAAANSLIPGFNPFTTGGDATLQAGVSTYASAPVSGRTNSVASSVVTEEMVARALFRILERSDARNGTAWRV